MATRPYNWVELEGIGVELAALKAKHDPSYPVVVYFNSAKERREFVGVLKTAKKNDAGIYAGIKGTK